MLAQERWATADHCWCPLEQAHHKGAKLPAWRSPPFPVLPAEGDVWGAAVRYALLAEQGSPIAQLNLAWILHHGEVYGLANRHRLAVGLWKRAAAKNQTEAMNMLGHVHLSGSKYGLAGGERARAHTCPGGENLLVSALFLASPAVVAARPPVRPPACILHSGGPGATEVQAHRL